MVGRHCISSMTGGGKSLAIATAIWAFVFEVVFGGRRIFWVIPKRSLVLEKERTSSATAHVCVTTVFLRQVRREHPS